MSTTKPYTLAGYAADRAHGDLDQDAMRATVEALDAAKKRIAELEAVLLSRHGGEPLSLLAELDAARARIAELEKSLATVTRERDEARASEARMREALAMAQGHMEGWAQSADADDEATQADLAQIQAALSTPASDWLAARDRRVAEMQREACVARLEWAREMTNHRDTLDGLKIICAETPLVKEGT